MMAKKIRYAEGDWFAIPLETGGYSLGLVARAKRGSRAILVYLFATRSEAPPTLQETSRYRAEGAAKVVRAGDLHLVDGRWPIIGSSPAWDRSAWPFPEFLRIEIPGGRAWRVRYSEDSPIEEISRKQVDVTDLPDLDRDGLYGAGAVEIAAAGLVLKGEP